MYFNSIDSIHCNSYLRLFCTKSIHTFLHRLEMNIEYFYILLILYTSKLYLILY